jgi:hypothetical protein
MASLIEMWQRRRWRPLAVPAGAEHLRPVAVITGASDGIGRAFAFELARQGYDLLLVARTSGPLEATAATISRETGRRAATVSVDLTGDDFVSVIKAKLAAEAAYPALLVNNAGAGLAGKFPKAERLELRRLLDLNMGALAELTHWALSDMLDRGAGGIINISSLGGLVPGPNQAAYYASKAFVTSLTEAIAWEVRGRGVTVTAVSPGPVATKFHARMGAEQSKYLRFLGTVSPERVARAGYLGHRLGLTTVYPRLLDWPTALALRLTPHIIMVPIVSWLLRKRNGT